MQPSIVKTLLPNLVPVALSLMLSACSGGSNNGGVDQVDDTVNGFHLVKSIQYNEFDEIINTRDYLYDLDLNRISVTSTYTDIDALGIADSTSREFYDEAGRLTLRESPDGNQIRTNTYTFDNDGLLLTSVTSGTYNETTDFEYDASGKLIRVVTNYPDSVDELGYTPLIRTYSYDDNGNLAMSLVEQSYFDFVVNMQITDTTTTTFITNSQGQRVRAESTDSGVVGSYTRMYSYDSNGNVAERIYDSGGIFYRTVYSYDANQEPIFNYWLRSFKFFP